MRDPSSTRSGLTATVGPEMAALALTIVLVIGVVALIGFGAITPKPGPSTPVGSPTPGPTVSVFGGSSRTARRDVMRVRPVGPLG